MRDKFKVVLGCFGIGCITALGITNLLMKGPDGSVLLALGGAIGGIIGVLVGKVKSNGGK